MFTGSAGDRHLYFPESHAVGYDGESECYSLDLFRRLYNDAVESMRGYQALASEHAREVEKYRMECDRLEGCLHEVCGD